MEPSRFLTALAQTLSTMALYQPGHPARERVIDRSLQLLRGMLSLDKYPEFSFLGDEVVYGKTSLRDLRDWDWSKRFVALGVQRLEFDPDVTRDDYVEFLEEMSTRLNAPGAAIDTAEARQMTKRKSIRYGAVGIKSETEEARKVLEKEILTATINFQLSEEIDAIKYMHEEVLKNGGLPLLEAEAVVRSLSVAMHGGSQVMLPLLQLKEFDQYTTTHSMNVAVLTMALAEYMGLAPSDVRAFGIAGLLHDVGKVRIPIEVLTKPGKLTPEERTLMNQHPADGARIILETNQPLDLAAIVAYEHHIMINGGGYPTLRFARDCHHASKLVHVCDVFDALRTRRPYRDAWPLEKVVSYLHELAGAEFDRELVDVFTRMMQESESRVAVLHDTAEAVPAGPA